MQVREGFWTTPQYTPAKRAWAKLAFTISGKVAAPASIQTSSVAEFRARLESSKTLRYKRRLLRRLPCATATRIHLSEKPMSSVTTHAPKGLEGVVATTSKICYIDGERGVLAYRGIDIHELADHSSFEETCYLLWYGKLPDELELKKLRQQLASERKIDSALGDFLRNSPKGATPMDVLRTAVSVLGLYDPQHANNER